MFQSPRTLFGILCALGIAGAGTALIGQSSPATRRQLDSSALPAIDLGLRQTGATRGGDAQGSSALAVREPNRVIVKFRSGVDAAAQGAIAARVGGAVVERSGGAGLSLVEISNGQQPEDIAGALNALPEVEYAQPSYMRQALFVPNDPFYSNQWNMTLLNMEKAWDINRGAASSVVVAVIDSGVAFQNASYEFTAFPFSVGGLNYPGLGRVTVPFAAAPDLGNVNRFVAPFDFVWDDTSPVDMSGHGTHVAGTIAQDSNNGQGVTGVAFKVNLMPIKVLASEWDLIFGGASDVGASDFAVASAIEYAVQRGAKVINLSLGGPGGPAPILEEAIESAVSAGAFVSISAGNDFEDGNPVIYPAALAEGIDGAVAVGAVGQDRSRAGYSTTGSYVELVAPGGNQSRFGNTGGILQQTLDGPSSQTYLSPPAQYRRPRFDVMVYDYYQGTSMAAPHVSGLAALLMSQGITRPAAIEAAMKRFATDLGPSGRDDEYGFGLIDPVRTLRGLGLTR